MISALLIFLNTAGAVLLAYVAATVGMSETTDRQRWYFRGCLALVLLTAISLRFIR